MGLSTAVVGLLARIVVALTDPGVSCHSDAWYEDTTEKRGPEQDCEPGVDE